MKHLSNVLVGLDFSKPSREALKEAYRICQWDTAMLTALHVVDHEAANAFVAGLGDRSDFPLEVISDMIRAAGRERVKRFVKETLGDEASVTETCVLGYPHEAVLKAVNQHQAELLVLGNCGYGRGASSVGAIAQRAVRRAACHVLMVRGEQEGPFKHVLACIDFSQNAKKAAQHAVHIAQQDNASLEFLHIVPPAASLRDTLAFAEERLPKALGEGQQPKDQEREMRLKHLIEPIVAAAGGVKRLRTEVQRAHPVREGILSHIEDTETDLVVVGATGKTGLKSIFLGTTAEAIVHHSQCSVLTIRPEGFEYSAG